MPAGRPSKINDTICEAILKEVKDGVPEGTAAQLAGIDKSTLWHWKKKAKDSKRKNRFTEFFNRLQAAKAYANKKHIRAIMDSKDWKARKYLLSLNDPTFNDTEKIQLEHTGNIEHKGKVDVDVQIPESIRTDIADLAARIEQEKDKPGESGTD
jgi:hypothetical protein